MTEFDIAYNAPLQEVLEFIDRYKAKLVGWKAEGPGGGNPYVRLEFPSKELETAAQREYDKSELNPIQIVWGDRS